MEEFKHPWQLIEDLIMNFRRINLLTFYGYDH
jgi:hypothetical protein